MFAGLEKGGALLVLFKYRDVFRIVFVKHVYEQMFFFNNKFTFLTISQMIRKLGKNCFKMTFYKTITQCLTSWNRTIC